MITIPKFAEPLTKAIRTSEGILVFLANFALGLGAIVDPSRLPPSVAAKWAAVLVVVHVIARTGLKVVAVQKSVGVGDPIDAGPLLDKVAQELGAKLDAGPTVEEVKMLIEDAVAKGSKVTP